MKKSNYHVYKLAFLFNLIEKLRIGGVPLDRLIKRDTIKLFDFSNPEKYLPAIAVYDFLDSLKRDSCINDIADNFSDCFRLIHMGITGEFLLQRPSLYHVIDAGIKFGSHIHTNGRLSLQISGAKTTLSYKLIDPLRPGRDVAEDIGMAMIVNTYEMFRGSSLSFLEVNVPRSSLDKIKFILPLMGCVVTYNQPVYEMVFPTYMLNSKIVRNEDSPIVPKPQTPSVSFASNVDKVLWNMKPGRIAKISHICDAFNMPARTVKRNLKKECTTFSQIKAQTIFLKAIDLLVSTDLEVREVSEYLGYTDCQNFIRAFKSRTGATPLNYRKTTNGLK